MPYINGTSADLNIPDFARFAPHAIRDEAGGFRLHFYSDQAGRLLSMCPTQVFWQDAISRVTEDLIRGHGVNGVYVDQISAMDHELCFDPQHGHPRGGGRYWADGNRELLGKLLSAARKAGGGAVITSESADEVFLDLVHANLFWMQPMEWEIPLMEVVYSGYAIFFGSPCDYRKSDRYFPERVDGPGPVPARAPRQGRVSPRVRQAAGGREEIPSLRRPAGARRAPEQFAGLHRGFRAGDASAT
jgi:hypothetical protein